jgi:PadR family transcriptional regulator PadR
VTRNRRPSAQTMTVLCALAADPARRRYGYELGQETGLKAGSLYPILVRLADRGYLDASWEESPPPGRPARHMYRITADGQELAAEAARQAPAGRRAREASTRRVAQPGGA